MLGPQEGSDLVPERCWCCLSWEGMGLDRGLENPVTPGSLGSGLEKQKGRIMGVEPARSQPWGISVQGTFLFS